MSIFKAYNAVQNVGNSMIDNLEKGATNKLNKIGNSTDNTIEPPPTPTLPTPTLPTPTSTPSESVTNGGKRIRTRCRKLLRRKTKKHRKQKKQKK